MRKQWNLFLRLPSTTTGSKSILSQHPTFSPTILTFSLKKRRMFEGRRSQPPRAAIRAAGDLWYWPEVRGGDKQRQGEYADVNTSTTVQIWCYLSSEAPSPSKTVLPVQCQLLVQESLGHLLPLTNWLQISPSQDPFIFGFLLGLLTELSKALGFWHFQRIRIWDLLVVQWLRIHLATQGTWVWSWIQGGFHIPQNLI